MDKALLDQIKKGVDQEKKEHNKTDLEALKIVMDHIKEDPKYYDKLTKAGLEELNEGEYCKECLAEYITECWNKSPEELEEAEYRGRKVTLGKPFLTPDGPKKRSVYVKNAKGNVVKVNFGQKGVAIKKHLPKHRKSYRARHHCDTKPGPKDRANYWSCRFW